MGSQLSDRDGTVVWGLRPRLLFREAVFGKVLARLALDENASDDGLRATGLLGWPAKLPLLTGIEPYREIVERLRQVVEDPDALLTFPYDWRRSIAVNAEQLRPVAREHLARWRARRVAAGLRADSVQLTFVCHSMGGLVARYATEVGEHALHGDVRQVVTLGTPFRGAVKALRLLERGEYLPLGLLARRLRDTGRTLPGLYELLPTYQSLVDGDELRRLKPDDLEAVGASRARAEEAFGTLERLLGATGAAPVRPMIGMNQPTLQSASIVNGEAHYEESLEGIDYGGDGTVFRRAAAPDGPTPSYLPQTHGAITKSGEALTFVDAVLTESALGPLQAEPTGIGVRAPDLVAPDAPFEVEITTPAGVPSCRVEDTDTNRQVAALRLVPRDDRLVAAVKLPAEGLYRITVSGAGLSPVRELVAAVAR